MQATTNTGHTCYCPEMGEAKPEAQIEARMGFSGKHWFLRTRLALAGRGITYQGTLTSADLVPQAQHKVGEREYKATEAAFERLCTQYRVVTESLL